MPFHIFGCWIYFFSARLTPDRQPSVVYGLTKMNIDKNVSVHKKSPNREIEIGLIYLSVQLGIISVLGVLTLGLVGPEFFLGKELAGGRHSETR